MTSRTAIGADDSQARAVAEAMLGMVDEEGHVEVAQAELARLTGQSARTLRRTLDRLRGAEWIAVLRDPSPNQPALYDLTPVLGEAAAAGLTPRREPAQDDAPGGARRLTDEAAADPIGRVIPGQRWMIDPLLLQEGTNVRSDLRVGDAFVDTIAGLGVLKDIDVYPTLTGLVILDGHRRHRAAINAGLEEVPVRIVDVTDEVARIGLQITENDEHERTSAGDRARAINQLVLMGMPAAELRKRGVRAGEVTKAKSIAAASQGVADLGDEAGLGFDDLAKIADLEGDAPADIVAEAVERIRESPAQIDHALAAARDAARIREQYDAAVLELRQQGVRVITYEEFYDGYPEKNRYVWDLKDECGMGVMNHETCPGHAAFVQIRDMGGKTPIKQVMRVCMDYKEHGHFSWEDNRKRARTQNSGDRGEVVEKNRQAAQEHEVRRAWIRDVLLRRKPPKDAALLEMPVIYGQWWVSTSAQSKARDLLGVGGWEFGSPTTAGRAAKCRFAWCLAIIEGGIGRDYWRLPKGEDFARLVRLHLRSLERWGYALGEGEQEFCEGIEKDTDGLCVLPAPEVLK